MVVSEVDSADSCVEGFAGMKESRTDDHQGWIDSWYKGTEAPLHAVNFCYVYTDGYYRKGRKGGHGVIIRDDESKPIVASAVASTEAVSLLYHQLQGVVRGVELALEYSFDDVDLFCNAKQVVCLLQRVLRTDGYPCVFHADEWNSFDVICKNCVMDLTGEDYPLVFPLLKRIAEMNAKLYLPLNVDTCIREYDKAADYLAKNGAPGMEKLSPCDFPDELKEILCKDYFEPF
ncbi:hypothetical protein MKX03_012261 [Papaver bracteatum]|nr:hypothetical protein MKX03_012259 [Papaver bracteatum]KAI3851203.1 hypothetical protein MKX03_012261 [Papaver bracteatum]